MVEQVGHKEISGFSSVFNPAVDHHRAYAGLAAAVISNERQPAIGRKDLFGRLVCFRPALGYSGRPVLSRKRKVSKSQVAQWNGQVAYIFKILLLTTHRADRTGVELAKSGIAGPKVCGGLSKTVRAGALRIFGVGGEAQVGEYPPPYLLDV